MHTVSREKLYEQVWKRPLMKVAADYNITGTALKKICDRHEIPTPERGYWAKLEHGKPVRHPSLPEVSNEQLAEVRIVGPLYPAPSKSVSDAKASARQKLDDPSAIEPASAVASFETAEDAAAEVPALASTWRAIRKARPDGEGFVHAKGRGIVPLKIGPSAVDRSIKLLAQLFLLAKTLGHQTETTDEGLVLLIDGQTIVFALEAPTDRRIHQPTPAELKEQARYAGWGMTREPWPKYDHFPSERLAIIIQANAYSGLRRTFSDRQTKAVEQMLPAILEAFAAHGAFAKERKREQEESARRYREAERLREMDEAFAAREKRRIEFADAVHDVLMERKKLADVLAHIDAVADPEYPNIEMIGWLRRRIRQLDALISPAFLDISARSGKVAFAEAETASEEGRYAYYPPVSLQYWLIDEEAGQARSMSALQWIKQAGVQSEKNE